MLALLTAMLVGIESANLTDTLNFPLHAKSIDRLGDVSVNIVHAVDRPSIARAAQAMLGRLISRSASPHEMSDYDRDLV